MGFDKLDTEMEETLEKLMNKIKHLERRLSEYRTLRNEGETEEIKTEYREKTKKLEKEIKNLKSIHGNLKTMRRQRWLGF